jgi:site-specific DNA-methyltransferase (adenine-specific)
MNNQILQGDCLEVMKDIPDKSIDMVLTSPPYNIGKMHSNKIQFGTYDGNNMNEEDYQSWQIQFINECVRVLKDDGSLFYNHKVRIKNKVAIHPMEWLLKTNAILKQEIVWDMGKSANSDKIRFFPYSERFYWFVKNKETKLFNSKSYSDVWRVVPKHKRKDIGHIAVMPVEIAERIIESTNYQTILDPFAGSGTTGVACKNLNRNYILIEKEPEYIDIINKRLTQSN